jgi:alpha-glucosidase (family GH31 glycosyl hydrolase)
MLAQKPLLTPMYFHYDFMGKMENDWMDQFLFGESLIVAPVLYQTVQQIKIYFPEQYYEFWGGLVMPINKTVFFSNSC